MLLGGKIFLPIIGIVLLLGFATGLLHYNHDKAKCMVSRSWSAGEWHTFAAIGRLEFRVKDYSCPDGFYLDPNQYQSDGFGHITPK